MNRIRVCLLLFVLVVCLFSQSVFSETPFSDVSEDAYYCEAVIWAVESGITGGTGGDTFSPEDSCTRAQAVTFLHRMVASPDPAPIDNPFCDVHSEDYYYPSVLWAYGSKITGGTDDTSFSPNGSCTRAQVVTFLWRTAGQPEPTEEYNLFSDVKAESYYYKAILWATQNGLTSGTAEGTFSPEAVCTRAQDVTFLYRFISTT